MAIAAAQVVVSSSAVALTAAEADTVSGSRVVLRNTHATDAVALGGSGVTAGAGFQLPALATLTVELTGGEQLFGIRVTANDVTVHVLRIGV